MISLSFDRATHAVVRPLSNGRAVLAFQGETFEAAIGPAPATPHKREGDDATPVGWLALRRVLYRADRVARPQTAPGLPVEPIARTDGWCDESGHPDYNQQVALPHDARCEALWRDDHAYDIVGVLGWNDDPVVAGLGSAIFLHLPTPSGVTEGCVAVSEPVLRRLLAAGIAGLNVEEPGR